MCIHLDSMQRLLQQWMEIYRLFRQWQLQDDGSRARGGYHDIKHLPVTATQKTLGIYTQPDDDYTAQLTYMQKQGQAWIDRVKTGKVPQWLVWLGIPTQMWQKVGYGISCSTATFKELMTVLQRQYLQILPLCEVNHNICLEFWQLPEVFFGIGLKAMVASLNLLLQHFGNKTMLGVQLKASYGAFFLELGLSNDLLGKSYWKYSSLCTLSWLKAIWERSWMFQINITIPSTVDSTTCQQDTYFMQAVVH